MCKEETPRLTKPTKLLINHEKVDQKTKKIFKIIYRLFHGTLSLATNTIEKEKEKKNENNIA